MNNDIKKLKWESKKLKWESEIEFKYRVGTGKIIYCVAKILTQIDKNIKENKIIGVRDKLLEQHKELTRLMIPERYIKVNEFLFNCLESYVEAGEYIESGMKTQDSKIIMKSGRLIKKGNAWMELAKIEIWSEIEKIINK